MWRIAPAEEKETRTMGDEYRETSTMRMADENREPGRMSNVK